MIYNQLNKQNRTKMELRLKEILDRDGFVVLCENLMQKYIICKENQDIETLFYNFLHTMVVLLLTMEEVFGEKINNDFFYYFVINTLEKFEVDSSGDIQCLEAHGSPIIYRIYQKLKKNLDYIIKLGKVAE